MRLELTRLKRECTKLQDDIKGWQSKYFDLLKDQINEERVIEKISLLGIFYNLFYRKRDGKAYVGK